MGLGYYYMIQKDYVKAAENFKKGLDIEPNDVEAWTLYAQNLDFGDKNKKPSPPIKLPSKKIRRKSHPLQSGSAVKQDGHAVEDDDAKRMPSMTKQ